MRERNRKEDKRTERKRESIIKRDSATEITDIE